MRIRLHSAHRMPGSDGKIADFVFERINYGSPLGEVTVRYDGSNARYNAEEQRHSSTGVTPYRGTISLTVEEICELFAFVTKKAPISKEWRQVSRALVAEIEKGGKP